MNKLTKAFEEIIKENVYGYQCKNCLGGGADGQDNCLKCNGTGIVDWNIELGIKYLIQAVKERDQEVLGKVETNPNQERWIEDDGEFPEVTRNNFREKLKQQMEESL